MLNNLKHRASEYRPLLQFTFDKVYSIQGIAFVWDTLRGGHPYEVLIQGYDVLHQKQYETLLEIDSPEGFYEQTAMANIKYVDITIYNWSRPNNRARLMEITFGPNVHFTSYNNGRIISAEQIDTSQPTANALPTNTMNISFQNYDKYFDPMLKQGISASIAQRQIAKYRWRFVTKKGIIEQSPEQIALLNNFTIPFNANNVNINLTSRLTLLNNIFKKENYEGVLRTLKDIALYVLENSNIQTIATGEEPWILSNKLQEITTLAPIPALPSNQILQLVALASCTWLSTDLETGYVKIQEPSSEISEYCEIGLYQALSNPEIKLRNKLKSIAITVYSYFVATEYTEIYKGTITLSGVNTLSLKYSKDFATDISVNINGASLTKQEIYTSYAILTISAAPNASVEITITGKEILQYTSLYTTYQNTSLDYGEEIVIDNPLITSTENAQLVSNFVKKYYDSNETYSLDYMGFPQLESGDKIHLSTIYGDKDVEVKSNKITYNGGWSGRVELV